jgi:outer membrane protein TolC
MADQHTQNTKLTLSVLLMSAFLMSACSNNKNYREAVPLVTLPAKPISDVVHHAMTVTKQQASTPERKRTVLPPLPLMLGHWWQFSNNAELTELMDRGLAHNRELRSASLRVLQSQSR